jgi:integrase
MPIDDLPGFLRQLREHPTLAGLCLEFAILTAARSGEVLGACWDEMDLTTAIWTIPAPRMKALRVHRVPLSAAALAALEEVRSWQQWCEDGYDDAHGGYVFPGRRLGKSLSSMALMRALRREVQGATVHGFRSTFRDWVGNHTSYPRELAEHALAHVVGNETEQAYRRDDALERRRVLMEAWGGFCTGTPHVIPFARQA